MKTKNHTHPLEDLKNNAVKCPKIQPDSTQIYPARHLIGRAGGRSCLLRDLLQANVRRAGYGTRLGLLSGVGEGQVRRPGNTDGGNKGLVDDDQHLKKQTTKMDGKETHKLELDGHQTEVDNLHSRPDGIVGLERWDIHVPELVVDGPLATTLGNGHGSVEAHETEGREDELVQSDPLQGWHESTRLAKRESPFQKAEPLELQGRHHETVGHEPRQSLEVKGRRQDFGLGNQLAVRNRIFDIEFVGQLAISCALFQGALAHGGDRLGDGVSYASQDSVGHHHGED